MCHVKIEIKTLCVFQNLLRKSGNQKDALRFSKVVMSRLPWRVETSDQLREFLVNDLIDIVCTYVPTYDNGRSPGSGKRPSGSGKMVFGQLQGTIVSRFFTNFETDPRTRLILSMARFIDGRYHGQEIWFDDTTREVVSTFEWKDDKWDGVQIRYNPYPVVVEKEFWLKGKRHGIATKWYTTGKRKARQLWVHGCSKGLCQSWHENGQLESEQTLDKGYYVGVAPRWDTNGVLTFETDWDDLSLRFEKSWDDLKRRVDMSK